MSRLLSIVKSGFVVLLGVSMLLPFLWMASTALMTELEVYRFPPQLLPSDWRWANFTEAMTLQPFGRFFLNTAIVAGASVAGQLLFCSMAAYALARLRFASRDRLFALYLGTMMIPGIVTIIPAFLIVNVFGWMNTYWALFTPTLSSAWGIFLMRQFFLTIPRDLEDAARVDGASEWTIFWRIVLPLSRPALATLALFAFMGSWNNFMGPLIYISSPEKMTLAYALQLFQGAHGGEPPMMMAAATLVMIPVLAVFFFTQRYMIQGVTLTGLKS